MLRSQFKPKTSMKRTSMTTRGKIEIIKQRAPSAVKNVARGISSYLKSKKKKKYLPVSIGHGMKSMKKMYDKYKDYEDEEK